MLVDRHDRESAAKAAHAVGGGCREGVRQAKIVARHAPEVAQEVLAGTVSLNVAYRQVIGDDRVPMYLKLDKDTDEIIRLMGSELGLSRQQVVLAIIAQWIGSRRAG